MLLLSGRKIQQHVVYFVEYKAIISDTFNMRGQVDLIDMQTSVDPNGFKWILHYQDHHSKFSYLRPLKQKC